MTRRVVIRRIDHDAAGCAVVAEVLETTRELRGVIPAATAWVAEYLVGRVHTFDDGGLELGAALLRELESLAGVPKGRRRRWWSGVN